MHKRTTPPANKSLADDVANGHPKPPLDMTALQQTPGFMIRMLQIQIFEEFFPHFAETGFSPAEHSVMITVRDNPSVTQSEVANALRIQLPNLVKVLAKLEGKDLIKRKRSDRDKRAVELVLTARGAQAAARAWALAQEFNRLTLAPLGNKDGRQFLQMLNRLVEARSARAD